LILAVALACKAIARAVAFGELAGTPGRHAGDVGGSLNVQGEQQMKLDVLSNELFLRTTEWGGHLAGMASEEMDQPYAVPGQYPRGKYLLLFDPLDGSSNIDVDVSVASIFSVLRAPDEATMLVLTVGNGVAGFTLDPNLGEFMLTHPDLRIPADTNEFAINTSNRRFWEPPVQRYVEECQAGRDGPRGKDFNMRWIASTVAEAHRILMRGGVFLYPRDHKEPRRNGRLRLPYEANPIGFVIEQAGGRASTGRQPVLGVRPEELHQRTGVVFGSRNEVERIERYHAEPGAHDLPTPLFAERTLFRAA